MKTRAFCAFASCLGQTPKLATARRYDCELGERENAVEDDETQHDENFDHGP